MTLLQAEQALASQPVSLTADALRQAFRGEAFAVETTGVDNAEEEPLEVGVPFSRAG